MATRIEVAQIRERYLLKKYGGGEGYIIDRDWLGPFASPYIQHIVNTVKTPKILEIGCGSGNSIARILDENTALKPSSITGTSLTELPEHQKIRSRGVTILTGILAEELPIEWTEQFDLIMACMVMAHTVLSESVPQVLRSLKTGGHFIGIDNRLIVSMTEEKAIEYESTVSQEPWLPYFSEIQSFVIIKNV